MKNDFIIPNNKTIELVNAEWFLLGMQYEKLVNAEWFLYSNSY